MAERSESSATALPESPAQANSSQGGERHASWLELFFDLCFVAAVAALATQLHEDPTLSGLMRFAGLFVPVWWAWMGFTWYAAAMKSEDAVFRLALLLAMLGVIALAASVSDVLDGQSSGFAVAYAFMQGLLSLLFLRARRNAGAMRAFCSIYAAGDALGATVWLSSVLVHEPARYWLWTLGLVVLMTTPVLAVRAYEGRAFDESHIPERYGLFTLIVLGESIVVVTAGVEGTEGGGIGVALVAVAGFILAACVWWVYFDFVKATALSRGRLLASFVWGYGHLLIFAGIAAAAVGIELAVEAAAGDHALEPAAQSIIGSGVVAYLLAISAIRWVSAGSFDGVARVRLGTALAVAALSLMPAASDPLFISAGLAVILVSETISEVARSGGRNSMRPTRPEASSAGPLS